MRGLQSRLRVFMLFMFLLMMCSYSFASHRHYSDDDDDFSSRLPSHINTGEKTVLVDPNVHAWGAYDENGDLVRAGLATSGSNWCPDLGRRCHTKAGSFRVFSLGSSGCKSSIFPLPYGGAPMPYCMFFNKNQALHGSYELADANLSHGCVRMHVQDAEWLRFNFVHIGTLVIVRPY